MDRPRLCCGFGSSWTISQVNSFILRFYLFIFHKMYFIWRLRNSKQKGENSGSWYMWYDVYCNQWFCRLGIFMPQYAVEELWEQEVIADHWRSLFLAQFIEKFSFKSSFSTLVNLTLSSDNSDNPKHFCEMGCHGGLYYGPGCSNQHQNCSVLFSTYPGKYLFKMLNDHSNNHSKYLLHIEVFCANIFNHCMVMEFTLAQVSMLYLKYSGFFCSKYFIVLKESAPHLT